MEATAFAHFSPESGRRLAHDAVLLMLHDAVDLFDSPDHLLWLPASNPAFKFYAALRIAATCWSGKHALLFFMWTFSDHSATKQLLLDIDVAFGSPPGTFLKKIEIIARYWHKLLHMPPQQKRDDERIKQMKDAFHEFEELLLNYHEYHQQHAGDHVSIAGHTDVATQAGDDVVATIRRLVMHYSVWEVIPEICNAAANADHQQIMADSRASKINAYIEVFHALQVGCGSKGYMCFSWMSVASLIGVSEVVEQTCEKLCDRCGLPGFLIHVVCRDTLWDFGGAVLSNQLVLPGGEGTNERLSALLGFVLDDEARFAVLNYLMWRQPLIRLFYDCLVARAVGAKPGSLQEQAENEDKDRASAPKCHRRSLGGA